MRVPGAPNAMIAFTFLFLSVASLILIPSHGLPENETLRIFKKSLKIGKVNPLSTWEGTTPPCEWTGVLCENDAIWGLQLEDLELSATINVDALMDLPNLRSISLMNNQFTGPLPEFKKLVALKSLFLSNNQFEGKIPDDAFKGMQWLKKVYLGQNKFTGEIPVSLTELPKLLELRLDGNQFSGKIPEFKQKLQTLNLSDNALTGPVPRSLSSMDPKAFTGNKDLCGKPLSQECGSVPLPTTGSNKTSHEETANKQHHPEEETANKKHHPDTSIMVAAAVSGVVVLLMLGIVILASRRKRQTASSIESGTSSLKAKAGIQDTNTKSSHLSPDRNSGGSTTRKKAAAAAASPEATKLQFLRDDREEFDLQDLLKASAEILGSGSFGASYKTALLTGPMMVVKRFKQMNNVGKPEFQEHMLRLGRLKHTNLLPLVAYYYRKEEKLLVGDFVERGSLAVHLHGHQSLGQPSLDWTTRLRIVKGVARGLQYLYKELPGQIAPHGHLKSSNVLLNQNFEPLLTDYGLIPLINQEIAHELMVVYKSPEYLQHERVTKKTDVWGLGILILEILTGRFPANFVQKGKGTEEDDLASWVNSVFQGEWASEVFDTGMGKTSGFEEEILKLLKIGMSCCEVDVEKRLDITEALARIEGLEEKEGDDELYSARGSTEDKSFQGNSSQFTSFS